MFKFLKKKLKSSVEKLSDDIDKEAEVVGEIEVEKEEKKGFFAKLKEKFGKEKPTEERPIEKEPKEVAEEKPEEPKEAAPEIEEAPEEEIREEPKVEPKPEEPKVEEKKEEAPKVEEKPEVKAEPTVEEIKEEKPEEAEEVKEAKPVEEKKGFFGKLKEKITTKKISQDQFDKLFFDFEVTLLENNVAVEVIEKIKKDLSEALVEKPLPRTQISTVIISSLKESIESLLQAPTFDILERIKSKKPYIICFVGINGSGKTTTIAKFVKLLQDNNIKPVVAASDTFRAAAIDQLEQHTNRLGVKLIKHDYGADPAAVAFDAIKYAESKGLDVVLIDTAGRMHSNVNLVDEMKKIVRVAKPDLKIFVGESTTGNDCIEQAKQFNEAVNVDGIVLAKADVDEKGGAALSVSYVTRKPILFLGTGQEYKDLKEFNSHELLDSLGLSA